MPSKVYNNVEDHRLLDNGTVCEDVTKVGLPTLEHPTDEIKASGMVMDIDMPNTTHLNASDFTIYHNNGVNCKMLANPGNWKKHYHGDGHELLLARRYSFSDRSRYYIPQPEVQSAIDRLFGNLRKYPIPMNMLHQYMPLQYDAIRAGRLDTDPRSLALYGVICFMKDYEYATN